MDGQTTFAPAYAGTCGRHEWVPAAGGADVPTEDACKTTLKRIAINQLLSRFVCLSPRLVLMGFATVEAEGYRNPRKNVFYSCGLM